MNQPFLIMLCGLPLAGKSTFCENYLADVDYTFVSTDDYIEKLQINENSFKTTPSPSFSSIFEKYQNLL